MTRSRALAALAAFAGFASFAVLSSTAVTSCAPERRAPEWALVRDLTPEALVRVDAVEPSLAAAPDGRVALTGVTRDSAGADVWFAISSDSGEHFSAPQKLDTRAGKVSSYAESRPLVVLGPAGHVTVAWASARDSGEYADDLVSRSSDDGGRTFSPEAFLNDDHGNPRSTYHGFLALDITPAGSLIGAWIDGRASAGETEPARGEIWSSTSDDGGHTWRPNTRVATDVCSCCRLALRADSLGHVAIAYRGARADLRDPRLAVSGDGGATFALDTLVSPDGWLLPACPSMGPAITIQRGGGGHYAWFTGAENAVTQPGVYVVPWRAPAGAAGARRSLGDSLREPQRPMLSAMGAATLAGVIAHSRSDSTRRLLAGRALELDGAWTPWLFLGVGVRTAAIAGATPRLAYAVWQEKSDERSHLRVVRLTRR
ncbi:MAG: exo-alpha-sialidase [Candidatus Eisenbacteria bacterium]|uniref:Exo-alpha-sialidase n=1 Tax=Eiseniibacteriota bacterium TaxID=2212470 RepID=A0A933SAC5_UNCEI|nr:exo-alpha-sialidase [Candidatus Eisenbacteria bacterium]